MNEMVFYDIETQCKDQFLFAEKLKEYTQNSIISEINKRNNIKEERKVKELNAIITLFGQATRIYNSSIILIRQGYPDATMILCRGLVEATINIDYIGQKDQYNRSCEYFKNGIKSIKIWKRSEISKNKQLYKEYELLCNATHNNYSAISKNIKGDKFNIGETSDNVEFVAEFINACYSYLICIMNEYFGLGRFNILNLGMPKSVLRLVGNFYYFKDPLITTTIAGYIEFGDKLV